MVIPYLLYKNPVGTGSYLFSLLTGILNYKGFKKNLVPK